MDQLRGHEAKWVNSSERGPRECILHIQLRREARGVDCFHIQKQKMPEWAHRELGLTRSIDTSYGGLEIQECWFEGIFKRWVKICKEMKSPVDWLSFYYKMCKRRFRVVFCNIKVQHDLMLNIDIPPVLKNGKYSPLYGCRIWAILFNDISAREFEGVQTPLW